MLEKNYQEFRSKSLVSRIFYVLVLGFKHLNVHLILVQKFLNFLVSFNKAIEIFGNFFENYPLDEFSYSYFLCYLELAKVQMST